MLRKIRITYLRFFQEGRMIFAENSSFYEQITWYYFFFHLFKGSSWNTIPNKWRNKWSSAYSLEYFTSSTIFASSNCTWVCLQMRIVRREFAMTVDLIPRNNWGGVKLLTLWQVPFSLNNVINNFAPLSPIPYQAWGSSIHVHDIIMMTCRFPASFLFQTLVFHSHTERVEFLSFLLMYVILCRTRAQSEDNLQPPSMTKKENDIQVIPSQCFPPNGSELEIAMERARKRFVPPLPLLTLSQFNLTFPSLYEERESQWTRISLSGAESSHRFCWERRVGREMRMGKGRGGLNGLRVVDGWERREGDSHLLALKPCHKVEGFRNRTVQVRSFRPETDVNTTDGCIGPQDEDNYCTCDPAMN